jgi:hypothetical protein
MMGMAMGGSLFDHDPFADDFLGGGFADRRGHIGFVVVDSSFARDLCKAGGMLAIPNEINKANCILFLWLANPGPFFAYDMTAKWIDIRQLVAGVLVRSPHYLFRSHGAVMTSVSTQMIGGRTIVTRRVIQNGRETVTVTENGVVTSRSIDGRPQPPLAAPETQV